MANVVDQASRGMGLPNHWKFFSPYPFSGINLQSSPVAVNDQEFLWVENFLKLGDGYLRTAWGPGAAFYTAPTGKTIISFNWYVIGESDYVAVFLSDGSAVQVAWPGGAQTVIGPAATFYNATSGFIPAVSQYGALYILISNRNSVNDYWAWDGALLYGAGTAAPNGVVLLSSGLKYDTLPTVTAFGGLGSGMVVVPSINAGGVVYLNITNPGHGYGVGDVVQLAFSGGGSDTSAILTANLNTGGVAGVNITGGGTGYTSATAAFSGGGGTGAAGTVIIGSGVATLNLTAGGSGYGSGAGVSFTGGGGSGATATATVTGGVVTALTITSPGSGYTSAPTVAIIGAGTGATATATVQNDIIIGVTMTNPGTGYTTAPTVTFSGTGTGATGVAVLDPTSVEGVTVVNPGSGFVYAPAIAFVGGGGTGATGTVELVGTSIAKVNVISGGQNYQKVPTVIFTGGGAGTGAAATAILGGGEVIAINLTDGGSGYTTNVEVIIQPANFNTTSQDTGTGAGAIAIFQPTSIAGVQMMSYGLNYTTAPAIEVQSGANSSAYATVQLMPFGVSGSSIETFQSRVWICDPAPGQFSPLPTGGNFAVSAPGSITDFATSDGGLLFTNSDSFLKKRYVAIHQSNGYLYFFGDHSCSVVSNVQTSGNPATTTFAYQNVDPQVGLSWRDSLIDFGRSTLFANETGLYGLYGGAVSRISSKLATLFDDAVFPPTGGALVPTSAIATLFDIKHVMMLMTVTDPDTEAARNVMVTWNEREWVVTSQGLALTFIGSRTFNSTYYAYGTDGASLYPLFAQSSNTLTKRLDTKLYGNDKPFMTKEMDALYLVASDLSAGAVGIAMDVTAVSSGQALQNPFDTTTQNATYADPFLQPIDFASPSPYWATWGSGTGGGSVPFTSMGLRFTTTSPDFALGHLMIAYHDSSAIAG